jgi:hypothetical protein
LAQTPLDPVGQAVLGALDGSPCVPALGVREGIPLVGLKQPPIAIERKKHCDSPSKKVTDPINRQDFKSPGKVPGLRV